MTNKYVSLEYLIQNTQNPGGIEFKGVFGNRSIGKTHGVLKYIYYNRKEGEAFMILRRNKLELNFEPFVQKFSSAFNVDWRVEGNAIVEYPIIEEEPYESMEKDIENSKKKKIKAVGVIVAYFGALSMSERSKHNNYDAPYVSTIIVDEVYAEKPNVNEFHQLQTWITTLSRRTGHPFHPITIWLLGNNEYGSSPIMEELGVFPFKGHKQKNEYGVFLFSTMESPKSVINVKNKLIKKCEVKKGNHPIITWSMHKQSFGLYDMGSYLYIKNIHRANQAYDQRVKEVILYHIIHKKGLPPIYVENYECLRFVKLPDNRLF